MSDIQQLEFEIKQAEDLVARRQMALKLHENYEFRKLFVEGYFKDEAARLIHMATDPRITKDIQDSCQEEARATGFMKRYLSDMVQMGYKAERELPEMRSTLEELRAAEASEA